MDAFFDNSEWFAYVCALIGPFIQEDAAVLGAASASVSGIGTPLGMFIAITVGLTISDLWKYWLGRAAISQPWARKHAESPRILKAKDSIVHNLGKSIMVARFVPGTRIPLYIAAGFFQASFFKFSSFIFLSALIYIGIAFTLFNVLGEVAGEEAKKYLPAVAIIGFVGLVVFKRVTRANTDLDSE